MRKAIKFCLALAMVGTMASVAIAEVTVSGNAWMGMRSDSYSDADVSTSSMDMQSGALTSIAGSTETGGWTAAGGIDLITDEAYGADIDWYWFSLAKDGMTITLDGDDLGNAKQGEAYAGWLDDQRKVGDHLSKGPTLVKVALDMGLTVMIGMNHVAAADGSLAITGTPADPTADVTAPTGSYDQTDMGLKYSGSAGDISYAVEYESFSQSINEDDGGVKDGGNDGATSSDLGIGVGYAMGTMAFNLGYGTLAETPGGPDAVETATTTMVLSADIGLDDVSGITFVYDTEAVATDGEAVSASTAMYLAYSAPMMGSTLSVAYYTNTTTPDGGDAVTTGSVGARLKYSY